MLTKITDTEKRQNLSPQDIQPIFKYKPFLKMQALLRGHGCGEHTSLLCLYSDKNKHGTIPICSSVHHLPIEKQLLAAV